MDTGHLLQRAEYDLVEIGVIEDVESYVTPSISEENRTHVQRGRESSRVKTKTQSTISRKDFYRWNTSPACLGGFCLGKQGTP
jgi:hypothetical protein